MIPEEAAAAAEEMKAVHSGCRSVVVVVSSCWAT